MRTFEKRGGTALVIVVATLSILAIMAATMARLAVLERDATRSFVAEIEARWAAEAGIERALAGLRELAASRAWDGPVEAWTYFGEDFDADGRWRGRREDSFANDSFEVADCPVEFALRPSFPLLVDGEPVVVDRTGISGRLDPRLSDGRDRVYTLKVLDCAGQIDVNGGLGSVEDSARIARRIDRAWELVAQAATAAPVVEGVGTWLIARRPPAGYADEREVRRALSGIDPSDPREGDEVFRLMAPHVTCHPWRDDSVVVPRGGERLGGRSPSVAPDDSSREQVVADSLLRYDSLEVRPRAPVNVNTASIAVLYSTLAELSGWVWLEGIRYHWDEKTGLPSWGRRRSDALESPDLYEMVRIDRRTALELAKRIADHRERRGPFGGWNDFAAFLDERVARRELSPWQASLVRAQADPNTGFNKRNPDAAGWSPIDKTDLVDSTTELCFSSMGRYEVESYGRVLDPRGRVLASARIDAVLQVYEVVRDTTGEDFGRGAVRPVLSNGRPALEIHAETDPRAGRRYDGQVGLATLRVRPPGRPTLHASFDRRDPAWAGAMEPFGNELPEIGPLVGPAPRGSTFLDGVWSERGVYPSFSSRRGYLSPTDGVIAFWYKPGWNIVSPAPRPHAILDMNGIEDGSTFQIYNDTKFDGAYAGGKPRSMLRLIGWDTGSDRLALVEVDLERVTGPREWLHITVRWTAREILLQVAGSVGSRSAGLLPDYSFDCNDLAIVEENGRWRIVPSAPMDADYFYGRNPPGFTGGKDKGDRELAGPGEATDPVRGGCGRVIPWPGGSPWFDSEESLVRFLEGLLTIEEGGDSASSPHYHNVLVKRNAKAASFQRRGPSPLVGTGSWFSFALEPIRFLFDVDPSAALRLGGSLKIERGPGRERSAGEPPDFDLIEAPSNGTYGDLVVYSDLPEDDPDIDRNLASLRAQGRYYKEGDAVFESRALGEAGSRLGTVSWRAHVPPGSAGLELEIGGRRFGSPGACALGAVAGPGPFRYRVRFLDRRSPSEPLFATPLLEEVAVTVLSPATFLAWCSLGDAPSAPWTPKR